MAKTVLERHRRRTKQFTEWMATQRMGQELSQTQLAAMLGLHRGIIGNIEGGYRPQLSLAMACDIVDALGYKFILRMK